MKKIGIVTFYNAYNYGAFFQQYALQKFLEQNGFDADIINYTSRFINEHSVHALNIFIKKGIMKKAGILYMFLLRNREWRDRLKWQKKFAECIKNELKTSEPFSYAVKDRFNDIYDFFVAGSDQVWNTALTYGDGFYFLDFVETPDKKKTYAVSFGFSQWQTGQSEVYAESLKDFKYALVREKSGQKLLNDINIKADTVLDPTFLIERKQWLEFSQKSTIKLPKKYIFIYVVQTPTDLIPIAYEYARKNNCEIILVRENHRSIKFENGIMKTTINISPHDFMNYLINAHTVFTTSFHGMILSIYNRKNFYYELLQRKENRNTRLEYMAELFELEHREIKNKTLPQTPIDWEKVNSRLEELQKYSGGKLLSSLE